MHAWEQIQETIEYMEDHLDEDIKIEQLARIACLSPFYYQRLFSRLVKKPVMEYRKLRRMAKAAELLLQKEKRIIDIALELGFSSHESFTRTFKSTFGMTPDRYRKNPITLNRMTKPELLLKYTVIDEGVPLIAEGIILEINRRQIKEAICFVGRKEDISLSYMEGLGIESGADPLGELWESFHEMKKEEPNLSVSSEEIGVTYGSKKEGCFRYFAGARVEMENDLEELVSWSLPAGEYVVCTFEAEDFEALVMDALYKAEHYLYNIWLPKHHLHTEAFCAERYTSHSPETKSMEVWLRLVE